MATDAKFVPVPGSEKEPLKGAQPSGEVPSDKRFEVSVRVRRRSHPPAIEGGAPKQMSRAAFNQSYGADTNDIKAVEDFARQHGLKVEGSSADQHTVVLSGTAPEFRDAFKVDLKMYSHPGGSYRGRTGPIFVPERLAGVVTGVFGLDDRPFAQPHFSLRLHTGMEAAAADAGAPHAGTFPTGFTPNKLAELYDFPTGVTGKGQTIGVIELGGGFRQSELDKYFGGLGLNPLPPPVSVAKFPLSGQNDPGTDALDPQNADVEVMLDLEVIGAVAPGAQMVVYFGRDASDMGFLAALSAAIDDQTNRPGIISISWGGPERTASKQFQNAFNQLLEKASNVGITVCVAAGDNGSADFRANDPDWDGNAHVDFPASSPFALACGGTRLTAQSNHIVKEVVWNEGTNDGTGGGISRAFDLPDYQKTAGVPAAQNPPGPIMRGVPDVSGNGAVGSGYVVLCDGQHFPDQSKGVPPVGGTSAVAPLWAGLIARINEALQKRVGFVHPKLYSIANSGVFRDITSGSNGDYAARAGWDPCTGLGSPSGKALLAALRT
jgi:kumamolisin